MVRTGRIWIGVCSLLGLLPFGCSGIALLAPDSDAAPIPQTVHCASTAFSPEPPKQRPEAAALRAVAYSQPTNAQPPSDTPFRAMAELSAEVVVEQVIARNPSLA